MGTQSTWVIFKQNPLSREKNSCLFTYVCEELLRKFAPARCLRKKKKHSSSSVFFFFFRARTCIRFFFRRSPRLFYVNLVLYKISCSIAIFFCFPYRKKKYLWHCHRR